MQTNLLDLADYDLITDTEVLVTLLAITLHHVGDNWEGQTFTPNGFKRAMLGTELIKAALADEFLHRGNEVYNICGTND